MTGREGHIKDGRAAVERIALYLFGWGFTIDSPELAGLSGWRPNAVNAPDIRVWRKRFPPPGYRVIEVKSSSYSFTGLDDWPFPDCILNRVDTWDAKEIKPFATVTVSTPGGGVVVLPTEGLELSVDIREDSRSGKIRRYYVAPRSSLVPIEWLPAALPMSVE